MGGFLRWCDRFIEGFAGAMRCPGMSLEPRSLSAPGVPAVFAAYTCTESGMLPAPNVLVTDHVRVRVATTGVAVELFGPSK